MNLDLKICGLNTLEAIKAAVTGRAAYIGFVFFEASPRAVTPDTMANLCLPVPKTVKKVGLFVDASMEEIAAAVSKGSLDMIQLHGSEPPSMLAKIRSKFGLPVMKAVAIACEDDLARVKIYENCADMILFDAKPPSGASRPGGNAMSFDWSLVAGKDWTLPWMLAGGINSENLAQAVKISGASAIDVSSGVEDPLGFKSPAKITELLSLAATL
jgi:phosphoribosylanthranilate isomerase